MLFSPLVVLWRLTRQSGLLAILSEGKLPNSFAYNTSKTANNAMMVGFARELEDTDAKIFALTPGPTSTDLNGHHPLGKSPAEGAKIIVDYSTRQTTSWENAHERRNNAVVRLF